MARTDSAPVRQQLVFSGAQVRALEELAAREGVSKSEIVRRALDAYEAEVIDEAEIEQVFRELRQAVHDTVARVDKVRAEVGRLASAEQRELDRRRIKEEVDRWAAEHPDELDAFADWIEGQER